MHSHLRHTHTPTHTPVQHTHVLPKHLHWMGSDPQQPQDDSGQPVLQTQALSITGQAAGQVGLLSVGLCRKSPCAGPLHTQHYTASYEAWLPNSTRHFESWDTHCDGTCSTHTHTRCSSISKTHSSSLLTRGQPVLQTRALSVWSEECRAGGSLVKWAVQEKPVCSGAVHRTTQQAAWGGSPNSNLPAGQCCAPEGCILLAKNTTLEGQCDPEGAQYCPAGNPQ